MYVHISIYVISSKSAQNLAIWSIVSGIEEVSNIYKTINLLSKISSPLLFNLNHQPLKKFFTNIYIYDIIFLVKNKDNSKKTLF